MKPASWNEVMKLLFKGSRCMICQALSGGYYLAMTDLEVLLLFR